MYIYMHIDRAKASTQRKSLTQRQSQTRTSTCRRLQAHQSRALERFLPVIKKEKEKKLRIAVFKHIKAVH